MADLTDADLTRIAALAEAATEPPWTLFHCEGEFTLLPAMREGEIATGIMKEANATFIAAARDAVPRLVSEVRRLREVLSNATELLVEWETELGDLGANEDVVRDRIEEAQAALKARAAQAEGGDGD